LRRQGTSYLFRQVLNSPRNSGGNGDLAASHPQPLSPPSARRGGFLTEYLIPYIGWPTPPVAGGGFNPCSNICQNPCGFDTYLHPNPIPHPSRKIHIEPMLICPLSPLLEPLMLRFINMSENKKRSIPTGLTSANGPFLRFFSPREQSDTFKKRRNKPILPGAGCPTVAHLLCRAAPQARRGGC